MMRRHALPAGRPRPMPVVGSSMAPTLHAGGQVAVVPTSAWHGDALYVLDRPGAPDIRRVRRIGRQLVATKDAPGFAQAILTDREFAEVVLGIVVDELADASRGTSRAPAALCAA